MAALSDMVDKTDVAIWDITDLRADLCEVELNPSPETPPLAPTTILAVVLRANLSAQESEIGHIQYHVTVLSGLVEVPKVPPDPTHPTATQLSMAPPIFVGAPTWNGYYKRIGPVLVAGVGNP
jgi:hypothetical protein